MAKHSEKTILFLCTGNYYRSRFAEVLFNSLADRMGMPWRASSRGLALERGVDNVEVATIWDPIAVSFCLAAGDGAKIQLRFGGKAGPEGGAKFIAGPLGTSGTEAGGIGGGRSLNNWAAAGPRGIDAKIKANTGTRRKRALPNEPPVPCHPNFMLDAFHRKRGEFKPALVNPGRYGTGTDLFRCPSGFAAVRSQSHLLPRHKPCLSAILARTAISR